MFSFSSCSFQLPPIGPPKCRPFYMRRLPPRIRSGCHARFHGRIGSWEIRAAAVLTRDVAGSASRWKSCLRKVQRLLDGEALGLSLPQANAWLAGDGCPLYLAKRGGFSSGAGEHTL